MAEKDLGYRRVQCTGRGSYIISLPKDWIQNVGLKRGNEIDFIVQPDLSLTLIPRKIREKHKGDEQTKLREYYISVDTAEEKESTLRMIKALYVISADIIRVHFKGENVDKFKDVIKNFARDTLLGAEIIDEKPDEITLQILIKHSEFPIENAVRRMAVVALSANRDSILALKNRSKELFQSVINAHHDTNRLGLYAVRQLKFGIERNLFRELGFKTPKEFLLYRIIVNDIKSISENALNVINSLATLQKQIDEQLLFIKDPIDEEVYSQLLTFNSHAQQLFEDSLKAMFKKDYFDAEKIITKRENFTQLENELIKLMASKKLDPNIATILRLMLDNSRRLMDHAQDIAELTLNRTVEEICTTLEVK
ncbi:MAG: AbrB/MazE/SpoVT family DNA-binding domain-containing protein [Candidatus Bathyarchaeota archaeon]|nr:AbrB/MazE/SpoVT family DNA-binding domain-containing protein [Candidatus Bathyarchaeota archaeon]